MANIARYKILTIRNIRKSHIVVPTYFTHTHTNIQKLLMERRRLQI